MKQTKKCNQCGKEIQRKPSHSVSAWEKVKYCSQNCLHINQRKPIDTSQRLCACGCGNYVIGSYINRTVGSPLYHKIIQRKFIHGHSNKTPEAKEANSKRKKGVFAGEKHPLYGTHRSESTKKKISDKKLALSIKPWLGKKRSKEDRIKMGASRKGRKVEEYMAPETVKVLKETLRANRLKQVFPQKDSSQEIKLQKQLETLGIIYEKHKAILGQPDIFIPPKETDNHKGYIIFSDGCWWHACHECKLHEGRNGPQTIAAKNQWYEDFRIKHELELEGYIVIRLWEHEIDKENFNISKFLTR